MMIQQIAEFFYFNTFIRMKNLLKIGLGLCIIILILSYFDFFVGSRFRMYGYGPGVHDFSKNLTGGYALTRTSAHEILIAPKDGWNSEIAIIPSKVVKVNTYKEFIIAERQGLKKRNTTDSFDGYEIPNENIKDYWILNTDENYVIKNLKFNNFKRKLDSLKIPNKINLIDVSEY